MINEICIQNIIPKVFCNEEYSKQISTSEIWQKEITFQCGEKYLISAPSGAGKSSFCSFISCNRSDYAGQIKYDDKDISTFDIDTICDIRRKVISYMPQNIMLFPELTLKENITLKNSLTHHKSEKEITEMLKYMGIADYSDRLAGKCSIGQQQRAQIILSLCQPFDFLIMDEPVSHLDDSNNTKASELITEELEKQGACLITTSVGYPLNVANAIHLSL